MKELYYKLLILRTPKIGPAKYNDLISRFGSAADAANALPNVDALHDMVMREMDRAADMNIHFICDTDDLYPDALRAIKNHPPIITARGNLETLRCPTVGIVGTRHATATGMQFVADLANEFVTRGTAVVSGMAIGTDSAAHRGALRCASDVATIAVLAGGVDYIWPLENESLYWQIAERGVIISEMPVGFVPIGTNFVQRNRWIAGISHQLIVGEADLNSGSMTTARFASEYGRDIWAIPSHPADSRAAGPNSLIKGGVAKMCTGTDDFFKTQKKSTGKIKNEKKYEDENSLMDKIGTIPVSESVLATLVKKSISEIKSELVVLELQGLVRKVDNGYIRM